MHKFPMILGVAVVVLLACLSAAAKADLTIEAHKARIKTEGGPVQDGAWNLWSNGRVGQPLNFPAAGQYRVRVRAWGSVAGGAWPQMALLLDEESVRTVTVAKAEPADYEFDLKVPAGVHEVAAAFLNDGVVGKEDRNLFVRSIVIQPKDGSPEPTQADAAALARQAEQAEAKALSAAREAIEKHRKTDAVVRVVDAAGKPVCGASVRVEQVGHEFLFGCNIYMFDKFRDAAKDAAYKRRFAELFNYATVGFYWRWYEHERGKPQYDYTDKVVAWCREQGIRMKGHPLLWADNAGVPPWSKGQPAPELQKARVEAIMGRYRAIEFWEVVNEPSHLPSLKIDAPYRWARQFDPKAYLIVNDYYVLGDGAPVFHHLLRKAIDDNVPFDGIGIQAHEPRTMRFPLDRVQRILDHYAALGRDLHITEFTPASSGQKMTGTYADAVWDEAAQADYAGKFYTLCFAHPAMRAITWWDLCDTGAWLKGGGMLRADLSPKPVYDALRKLIHDDWTTRTAGQADAEGRFAFRGFRGRYRITVQHAGKTATAEATLCGKQKAELVVTVK